jgi:hypothetical protein
VEEAAAAEALPGRDRHDGGAAPPRGPSVRPQRDGDGLPRHSRRHAGRELAAAGAIKAVADHHYAFMGAAPIRALKAKANELAGLLKKDKVDAVLLSPV